MNNLVADTECPSCGKKGSLLKSVSSCNINSSQLTYASARGTLTSQVCVAFKNMIENGTTKCANSKCRGNNVVKMINYDRSTFAKLFIIQTAPEAALLQPDAKMQIIAGGAIYTLTGRAHFKDRHWYCTYLFEDVFYEYNDLSGGHPCTNDNTGMYFYIST